MDFFNASFFFKYNFKLGEFCTELKKILSVLNAWILMFSITLKVSQNCIQNVEKVVSFISSKIFFKKSGSYF